MNCSSFLVEAERVVLAAGLVAGLREGTDFLARLFMLAVLRTGFALALVFVAMCFSLPLIWLTDSVF